LIAKPQESAIIKDLVLICGLHGRYALHLEAKRSTSGVISLNGQAKELLFFNSNSVVPGIQRQLQKSPAMLSERASPFTDPNISCIQMERSFPDTLSLSPKSPNLICRPRRRISRNQTPQRLDEVVGIYHGAVENQLSTDILQTVIEPLLISSCKLFSEWLAVSSCPETAAFISIAVSGWCEVLISTARHLVLPSFFRLISQLILQSGNCKMLEEVSFKMCDDVATIEHFRKALSTVLLPKASQLLRNEIVHWFLRVTYDSLMGEVQSGQVNLPDSCDDEWIIPRQPLCAILMAIIGHQQARRELINTLVKSLAVHVKETNRLSLAIFDVQCLWLVFCDAKSQKSTVSSNEVIIEAIRKADVSELDENVGGLIRNFLSRV
jgi:hypothetical protein